MTILITCGPAWEPIDGMRRLTNASTGRLGSVLADALAKAGHRILLFRADGSTAPPPKPPVRIFPFGTNDQLARGLAEVGRVEAVGAVLHAAALCDFKVSAIRTSTGEPVTASKIPTRAGGIQLDLEPATKVLPQMRTWFPEARIVGWKYELNGSRDNALAAAWRQLEEVSADACVLNGRAWGEGYALCERPERVTPCTDTADLAQRLSAWIGPAS